METVLIQRNEKYQQNGVWVFVNDLDIVRNIVTKYGEFGTTDEDITEFVEALEEMPLIDSVAAKLAGENDCYIHDIPVEWTHPKGI